MVTNTRHPSAGAVKMRGSLASQLSLPSNLQALVGDPALESKAVDHS